MKKLVYGVGLNDADYVITPTINGKRVCCKYYEVWHSMMRRCYSIKLDDMNPTYLNCSVTEKWHSFMTFKGWMTTKDWQGNELDKDILVVGNKVYSPETCCFVTQAVNALLTDSTKSRGLYPQGVGFHKASGRYQAKINLFGKQKHLGLFTNQEEASSAYIRAKSDYILEIAEKQTDSRIRNGLIKHAAILRGEEK